MALAHLPTLDLCYETTGDPSASPLLLIAGLDMQLIGWPPALCERLAAAGHYVIRYDNRDIGLSSHFPQYGRPDLAGMLAGRVPGVGYLLSDMAEDAAGLLDCLGIGSAHVVGISMGGMIAQTLAINHPERLRSLCSIMSNTGDPTVGQPTHETVVALLQPPPQDRQGAIDFAMNILRVIGSPAYPSDDEAAREQVEAAYDRCHDPDGVARQAAAILASGDRTAALGDVRVPTLVIHGDSDALVDVSGGRATAAAIPGAQLLIIEGMGHDLPIQLYDRVLDAVIAHSSGSKDRPAGAAS